jgi:hypothetical protein
VGQPFEPMPSGHEQPQRVGHPGLRLREAFPPGRQLEQPATSSSWTRPRGHALRADRVATRPATLVTSAQFGHPRRTSGARLPPEEPQRCDIVAVITAPMSHRCGRALPPGLGRALGLRSAETS